MSAESWIAGSGAPEGLQGLCDHFQLDLSRLVDGEIESDAADRALLHMEVCCGCRDFFDDVRRCVQAHRDLSDPDRLLARLSILTGREATLDVEGLDLAHRLATVFYRLGKAYVLIATSSSYRQRVFENVVPLVSTQLQGRGFVDGVMLKGSGEAGGVDWQRARGLLNGRLEAIAEPLEKGQRLLKEAISVDPAHEEARLYLAHVHAHEGRRMRAAEAYRDIFRSAIDDANRGHAAMQLGLLYASEKDYRKALACFRWVTISGLADRDPRFFPARFNIGIEYAFLGQVDRSLGAFRALIDRHPDRLAEIADLFADSRSLQARIESVPGFLQRFVAACPELFGAAPADAAGPSFDGPDFSGFGE